MMPTMEGIVMTVATRLKETADGLLADAIDGLDPVQQAFWATRKNLLGRMLTRTLRPGDETIEIPGADAVVDRVTILDAFTTNPIDMSSQSSEMLDQCSLVTSIPDRTLVAMRPYEFDVTTGEQFGMMFEHAVDLGHIICEPIYGPYCMSRGVLGKKAPTTMVLGSHPVVLDRGPSYFVLRRKGPDHSLGVYTPSIDGAPDPFVPVMFVRNPEAEA